MGQESLRKCATAMRPYEFQLEGMLFGEAGLQSITAWRSFDEMGLGKTIHGGGSSLLPSLSCVPDIVDCQERSQVSDRAFILNWMGPMRHIPQIVHSSKEFLHPWAQALHHRLRHACAEVSHAEKRQGQSVWDLISISSIVLVSSVSFWMSVSRLRT